jgi:ferredoxin
MSTGRHRADARSATLVLDPTRCDGRGLCHDAAPELIGLDEWGYPLLPGGTLRATLTGGEVRAGHAAAAACPLLALHIEN